MDVSEQLVERFITANGSAFVCPQFRVQEGQWVADIDFLVIDYKGQLPEWKPRLVMVEVSDSGNLSSVETKARAFASGEFTTRISQQRSAMTDKMTMKWPILFLGFVRTPDLARRARALFQGNKIGFRSLDECIGNWWDVRPRGLMPTSSPRESV